MDQDIDGVEAECWCCATPFAADTMIHLGHHPEVTICRQCAHFLHKEAGGLEDAERTGFGPRARDQLRQARRTVVERGWHRSPVVGGALRRLGRYVP